MHTLSSRGQRAAILFAVLVLGSAARAIAQPALPRLGMAGMPSGPRANGESYDAQYAALSAQLKRKSPDDLEVARTIWEIQLETTESNISSSKDVLKDLREEPKETTQAIWMLKSRMAGSGSREKDPKDRAAMAKLKAEQKVFLARFTGASDPKFLALLIAEARAELKDAELLRSSLIKYRP